MGNVIADLVERPECSHCLKIGVKCEVFPASSMMPDYGMTPNHFFGFKSFSTKEGIKK
jgi:hypothetical protein